jgi:hypothetical protein
MVIRLFTLPVKTEAILSYSLPVYISQKHDYTSAEQFPIKQQPSIVSNTSIDANSHKTNSSEQNPQSLLFCCVFPD